MLGISDITVYLPHYYLDPVDLKRAWNAKLTINKSVANFDEDAISMSVESARLLEKFDEANGLIFCSTTSPYELKQASAVISAVLDMNNNIISIDISNSYRGLTAGIIAGLGILSLKRVNNIIVTSGEIFRAKPNTSAERLLSDGAASVMLSYDNVVLKYIDSVSMSSDFYDIWKKKDDVYPLEGDSAFVHKYGFSKMMTDSIKNILKINNLDVGNISKFAINAPDSRNLKQVKTKLGIADKAMISEKLISTYGYFGTAGAGIVLYETLLQSNQGDILLLGNYGNGNCDVVLFRVTECINEFKKKKLSIETFSNDIEIISYYRYLSFRKLIDSCYEIVPFSSPLILWKEIKQTLNLVGSKCNKCGAIFFPKKRVCSECNAKDNYYDHKLPLTGTVFTYTQDSVGSSLNPPTQMVVVDLDGGGRFYGQLTDCDKNINIGDRVEFTFRYFHKGGGYLNYFWKLKPSKVIRG